MDGDDKDKEIARLRAELAKYDERFELLTAEFSRCRKRLCAWENGTICRDGESSVLRRYFDGPQDLYRELGL